MQKVVKQDAVFIFLASVFLFIIGLQSQEIIGFESRFYLFALEMWRHGVTWFPTTYSQPYPDYPVTSTLLIYGCAKLNGGLNKLVAVLPSAIACALTVSMTYCIGAVRSTRIAWAAVFFLFFTLTFITEARTISLDAYVMLVTTVSFYLVYRYQSFWLVLLMLLVGFAFRGPLGLVIPTGVVCSFYLLERNWRQFFQIGIAASILLIIATALLMVIAHQAGGSSFMHDVLHMQVGSRVGDPHSPPFYFYFTECFGGYFMTYPLALLCLVGYCREIKNQVLLKTVLGWAVILLLGLSIPSDKKMRYILPFAPALALICAHLFAEFENKYLAVLRQYFLKFCFYFPALSLIAIVSLHIKKPALELSLWLASGFLLLQIMQIFLRKQPLGLLFIAAMTFTLGYIYLAEPINLAANKTRDFVLFTENLRATTKLPIVFLQEGADGLAIKYLVNMLREEQLLFLDDVNQLINLKSQTLVIASPEHFNALPKTLSDQLHLIKHSKIGHDDVMLLQRN